MNYKEYNRENAVKYAEKWAYSRNPRYYNFDSIGGDCTSFVSQCIFAGSNTMNYTKIIYIQLHTLMIHLIEEFQHTNLKI